VTARKGYQRPINVRQLQLTLGQRASAFWPRNSESRMREKRLSGLMRGGKQTVIGPRASQSVASRLLYTPDTVGKRHSDHSLSRLGESERTHDRFSRSQRIRFSGTNALQMGGLAGGIDEVAKNEMHVPILAG